METFVMIIVVLALLHFIYESIILPSILLKLDFKIDKLKDEAVSVIFEEKDKTPPMEFNLTMLNLDASSKNLKTVSFIKILKGIFFIKKNPTLVKKYDKIEKENSSNKKLIKIKEQSVNYVSYALLANSFMFVVYLFPLILAAVLFLLVFGKTKKAFKIVKTSYEIESNIEEIPSQGYCLA